MWYLRPLTDESIEFLHERVLEADPNAEDGYSSRGLAGASMERATEDFFNETQYEGIYEKTAALVQGIINFHPFTDGNKRTALLASTFFLFFHGYKFNIIREDILRTFVGIAKEEISDIEEISEWVEKNTSRLGFPTRFLMFAIRFNFEEIDLVSILGGTGIVTRILERMEKAWPEETD